MKKRGSMAFLMELIVVILFFSLSTAVTLGGPMTSGTISPPSTPA